MGLTLHLLTCAVRNPQATVCPFAPSLKLLNAFPSRSTLQNQANINFTASFLPSTFIAADLAQSFSNATLQSLSFPPQIQSSFISDYNLQLHVSYIFFVISLIWTGIATFYGLFAFIKGALGAFTVIFTSSASTCLLISSAILTSVQSQATVKINEYGNGLENGLGNGMGVMAGYSSGLLVLSWLAFGLSSLSTVAWGLAGSASAAFRDTLF